MKSPTIIISLINDRKKSERPKQYRPRSAHRDLNSSTEFFADTEAARAYRAFEMDEINNSRARIRRLGSTHGRIDPKNEQQFAKETTVNRDYVSHPFSKVGSAAYHVREAALDSSECSF
jgi:hypothetical protein